MNGWDAKTQGSLVRLAARGLTGSEIAEALGFSRNAVMGRAHRTGVKLPLDVRKRQKTIAACLEGNRRAAIIRAALRPEKKRRNLSEAERERRRRLMNEVCRPARRIAPVAADTSERSMHPREVS